VVAAKHYGKVLELNNKSFDFRPSSSPNCNFIAKLAHKHELTVAINSDAHLCYGVGECEVAIALAEETGIDERYILNASAASVAKFLAQHSTRQLAEMKGFLKGMDGSGIREKDERL
jgi:putative hydrolase